MAATILSRFGWVLWDFGVDVVFAVLAVLCAKYLEPTVGDFEMTTAIHAAMNTTLFLATVLLISKRVPTLVRAYIEPSDERAIHKMSEPTPVLPAFNGHFPNQLLWWIDGLHVERGVRTVHEFGKIENDGLFLHVVTEPDMFHPDIMRVHLVTIFLPPAWQRHRLGTIIMRRFIAFCEEHKHAFFVGPFVVFDGEDDNVPTALERILHKIGGFLPAPPGLLYRPVRRVVKRNANE